MSTENLGAYARAHGLKAMGSRPPYLEYLRETWRRVEFAWTLAALNKEAENAHTRLGAWWMLIVPIIQSSIYGLIFGIILGSLRAPNFIPYLITGVFLFSFISGSFATGASSITGNQGLIRSINFPRMVMPMSAVFRQFINLMPTIPVLVVIVVIFCQAIKWQIVILPVILAMMVLFGFGIALIAGRLTVQIRDLSKLVPFVTRIMFYTSGVFFHPSHVGLTGGWVETILNLNPIYCFLSLARGTLVTGYELEARHWLVAGLWTLGVVVVGSIYFWRAEERYAIE